MPSRTFSVIAACVLAGAAAAASPREKWTQLKSGMSAEETAAVIGRPLIRTSGRGYELWIYDSCAEVLFQHGPVAAWTVPVPNPVSEARPIEHDFIRGVFFLPPPAPRARPAAANAAPGYLGLDSRFRYRPRR